MPPVFANYDFPHGTQLQQAGGTPSTQDVTILSERLDPNERGKIDQEAFVTWLTSGLDRFQARSQCTSQSRYQQGRERVQECGIMDSLRQYFAELKSYES